MLNAKAKGSRNGHRRAPQSNTGQAWTANLTTNIRADDPRIWDSKTMAARTKPPDSNPRQGTTSR
jgi:hypothetical protein